MAAGCSNKINWQPKRHQYDPLSGALFDFILISLYYQNIFLTFVLRPEAYCVSHIAKHNIWPNNKTNTTNILCTVYIILYILHQTWVSSCSAISLITRFYIQSSVCTATLRPAENPDSDLTVWKLQHNKKKFNLQFLVKKQGLFCKLLHMMTETSSTLMHFSVVWTLSISTAFFTLNETVLKKNESIHLFRKWHTVYLHSGDKALTTLFLYLNLTKL